MKTNYFLLNRHLHRDIGYFCIGLTIIFAVSGIAVNHIDDWNPNYSVSYQQLVIPGISQSAQTDSVEAFVLSKLPFEFKLRTSFWQSPQKLKLFGHNEISIDIDIPTQTLNVERVEQRPILRWFNYLHLNEAKQSWTYFSDLYAVLLLYLSISALFMVKGKNGAFGKRGRLVIAGIILPVIYIFLA